MKRLKRLLLIHWYTYEKELIEFENINFLTGKTAAGKSTIIDALQLIILGETSGHYFNKAANAGAERSLRGYLYGENGDDGNAGFRYLRSGTFTSYVLGEYEDTESGACFFAGIICDCYADLHFEHKWVIVRTALPENCFVDEKSHVPLTFRQFKDWLKEEKRAFEIAESNKNYQAQLLGRFGSLKQKYLTLFKKAVPFTPITDIEKFITESICDVKNQPQIEQMQSDIRQYKNLEAEAERAQEKIERLEEIRQITREYEGDRERARQQDYIILRAQKEGEIEKISRAREKASSLSVQLEEAKARLLELERLLKELEAEITKQEEEYHSSDLIRKKKSLEGEIEALKAQIKVLEQGLLQVKSCLSRYGKTFGEAIGGLRRIDYPLKEEYGALSEKMGSFGGGRSLRDAGAEFDFPAAAVSMKDFQGEVSEYGFELRGRIGQLRRSVEELKGRIDNLKKGIKPYPVQVTGLKKRIESALFSRYRKSVEVPIFAELLEIADPKWQDAVEGYLDRQKFNLLVPEAYYADAQEIYNQIRREEKIYDAGIVDLKKMKSASHIRVEKNSLAKEVRAEDPAARLYADYLLGQVIKCESTRELNTHRIAITPSVMLYKNYVTRRLNPQRYADPFIGRRSMEIQIEKLSAQLDAEERELDRLLEENRIVSAAASIQVMSEFEAAEHARAMEKGRELPELDERLSELVRKLESLDLSWLNRLRDQIEEEKGQMRAFQKERDEKLEARGRLTLALEQQLEQLPLYEAALKESELKIEAGFEADWVEQVGEPRFLKELQKEAQKKGSRQRSLLESFSRARAQTETIMEGHRKERRKKRGEYNLDYRMPYDTEREDNAEYDKEFDTLSGIRLPEYLDQIRDAREKAYSQFRDDFIAKLKSNIETVREQLAELNHSLKNSVFGTDRYHFTMSPRAEYRSYYDMITDPMLMDTGDWLNASQNFNEKYKKEIDQLFKALIINETEISAERRAEYERSIKKYTDYKTYLVFDLIVTNEQGEEQRLSRTLSRKSGGETQIPFYIALLASFSQVCRIRSKGRNSTVRLIILDEAFSKMDGERIKESITLLRRFGLQAIFSAPPEKIAEIAPMVDRNIAVYKDAKHSFTRCFDPAQVENLADGFEEGA